MPASIECIKGNPKVFDVNMRPWVDVSQAPAKMISEIIDKCPSGALKYELKLECDINA